MDSLVGRRLGEFVVREELSSGGFGTVYRAEQPALAREAVIKVMHTRLRASERLIARFLREARLASRLDHPFAAHIYAFGAEADGVLWIAMELVRGTPLDRLLETQGTIPLERYAPLLERICQVVQTAHEQGIVHRDLKPGNVMVLSRAGQLLPKLLDFGIAKLADDEPASSGSREVTGPLEAMDDNAFAETMTPLPAPMDSSGRLTEEGSVMGSPLYMAPEQWTDAATVDARTDIYALGVMSYEALTGKPPFTGDNRYMIALAHAQQDMAKLGSEFPPALDAVLAKAVAKQAADRYASALELAAAFKAAAGIVDEPTGISRLPDELRIAVTARAPQPIAQAASALEAARNPHQARDALWQLVRVAIRYVALTALSAHAHVRKPTDSDIADAVRRLRGRALPDAEWLALAGDLVKPFATLRDAYPIPELVDLFAGSNLAPITELLAARDSGDAVEQLAVAMPLVERMLRALAFLADYRLVVVDESGDAQLWMGLRRNDPARVVVMGRALATGQPALLDAAGLPIVMLWPFVQVHEPAPGVGARLMMFEGKGRRGARLVALPEPFEHDDDALWDVVGGLADDRGARTSSEESCPYPGLASFTASDAARFFGRERETESLVNRLRAQPIVAVVGPSGAGKSSFVHAGVVPNLPEDWEVITLRPGAAPLVALTARLAKLGLDPARLRVELLEHAGALGTMLRARGKTTVIVVDQLEELFTLCEDEAERELFADALIRAARSPDDPVRLVVTLRDDFLLHAEALPALRARLAPALHLLTTPGRDDLRRILVEPLRAAGYELDDPTLAAEMIDTLVNTRSALALVSFTGTKLWELRDRRFRQITRKAYTSLGGVGGALARHAEATLDAMTPEQQRLVRVIFHNAVTADGTRAVLSRAELDQILGGRNGAPVIEALIASRLLVASESPTGGEQIELTHEALIEAWPRLVTWRREDAEGVRLRDQLRQAARQWDERGRPTGLLWRGDALAEYRLWRTRHPGALTDIETAFATASLDDSTRSVRRRRVAIASVLGVLTAGLIGLVVLNARVTQEKGVAEDERKKAETSEERTKEAARKLDDQLLQQFNARAWSYIRDWNFDYGLTYLDEAAKHGARGPRHDLLAGLVARGLTGKLRELRHSDAVLDAAFSLDGTRIVTAGNDNRARVWSAGDGHMIAELAHAGAVTRARFTPDGGVLTASEDGTAVWWDASGAKRATFSPREPKASLVAAIPSSDGRTLLTLTAAGGVALWEADGKLRALLRAPNPGDKNALNFAAPCAFSPDGARVAVGDAGGTLFVWDTASGTSVATTHAHHDHVNTVAFSPDGARILTSSDDHSARVFDAGTLASIITVAHTGSVNDAVFSPDGKFIATASNDHTAKVWDAATGETKRTFALHTAGVNAIRYSPDGAQLASAGDDDVLWLWEAATGRPESRLAGHAAAINVVQYDPSGAHVVTASPDDTAVVWSTAPQMPAIHLVGHEDRVLGIAMSHDGKRAATASVDRTARIWNAITGAPERVLHHASVVQRVAFSSDDRRIATGDGDSVRIWDVETGALVTALPVGAGVTDLVWGPGDATLVAGGTDNLVHLFAMPAGTQLGTLVGHDERVVSVGLSPTGDRIVTTSPDHTTRVWADRRVVRMWTGGNFLGAQFDPQTGAQLVAHEGLAAIIWNAEDPERHAVGQMTHDGLVLDTRWSTHGEFIVTAGLDATVRVWDRTGAPILVLGNGHTQWWSARFSPDDRRIISAGPGDVMIWDLPSPVKLDELVRCRRFERLDNDQIVPVAHRPSDCT